MQILLCLAWFFSKCELLPIYCQLPWWKGRRNEWELSVCHHWCWESVPRCQKVSAQILIEAWLTIRLGVLVFAPKKLLRAISVKSTLHIPLIGWWSPTPKKWQREMKDFKSDSPFNTWICVVVAVSSFQHIDLNTILCERHLCSINRFIKKPFNGFSKTRTCKNVLIQATSPHVFCHVKNGGFRNQGKELYLSQTHILSFACISNKKEQ